MRYSDGNKDREIRIEVEIVLPGSLPDIMDQIITRVVRECGTQVRAARYLRISAATISKRLNHRRRVQG
jgi:hypothetical protein